MGSCAGGVGGKEYILCHFCTQFEFTFDDVGLRKGEGAALSVQLSIKGAFIDFKHLGERADRMRTVLDCFSQLIDVYQTSASFQTRICASYSYIILANVRVVNRYHSQKCELTYTKVLQKCEM